MKNLFRSLVVLATVLLSTATAFAQTTVPSTTLSSAITSATSAVANITLTSVTCTGCTFGADTLIYIDHEAMRVTRAYTSGTTVPVQRGTDGTRPALHSNAAVVYYGPATWFHGAAAGGQAGDPSYGRCIRNQQTFLPWINISTGWVWLCDNVQWRATVVDAVTFNSR